MIKFCDGLSPATDCHPGGAALTCLQPDLLREWFRGVESERQVTYQKPVKCN